MSQQVILTSRKFASVIDDRNFRKEFPEFVDLYKQYDRLVTSRRQQGKCSRCGNGKRVFPLMVDRVRSSRSLALRVKEFFKTEKLKVVSQKDGKVEIETLA